MHNENEANECQRDPLKIQNICYNIDIKDYIHKEQAIKFQKMQYRWNCFEMGDYPIN